MHDRRGLTAMAAVLGGIAAVLSAPQTTRAHCDTMDGPVVRDAQAALKQGDPTPVLKWVPKDNEDEIRTAFNKTLIVRTKGPEARELADAYFFETLVRIHRQGEGEPYTGLKPAGTPLEPGVAQSDQALATGTADELVESATAAVATGIRERFAKAAAAKRHAGESVDAGRTFVTAYVEFVHYVEGIFAKANAGAHAHGEPAASPAPESGHRH